MKGFLIQKKTEIRGSNAKYKTGMKELIKRKESPQAEQTASQVNTPSELFSCLKLDSGQN